ncbi:hypothetical protein BRARA_A03252 [Brassica rapa]|uniref:F-box associated beta-propeller type 1 domain-containing protein n=1 Tax=Brassica campestris TaxID=3711 RepID=A0A398ASG9_BRACM|nr:hypothetical protein BRARA_A03252 [Brassica rapa]
MATMFNLPDELAEEILSRVPLTSLSIIINGSSPSHLKPNTEKNKTQSLPLHFQRSSSCTRQNTNEDKAKAMNGKNMTPRVNLEASTNTWFFDYYQRERFGKRLPLPSKSHSLDKFVFLSCVREEQLAVLHVSWVNAHAVEIWVTNKIAPGEVSWIKFVRSISVFVDDLAGSFFIDEEKKVAVVLDLDKFRQPWTETCSNQRANIIGQDGYSKPVNLGEVTNHGKREKFGFKFPVFGCPILCPYVPSSGQLQLQP